VDEEEAKRIARVRRWRNIAMALALGALVILFFVMTMVRLKGHVIDFAQ
jgi:hypothetical protein